MLAQHFGGLAYFALSRKEDQHIATADTGQFVDRISNRLHQRPVVDIVCVGRVDHWSIAQLDWIQPTRDLNDRCRTGCSGKVLRKPARVDRRGRDDHFQIGTLVFIKQLL